MLLFCDLYHFLLQKMEETEPHWGLMTSLLYTGKFTFAFGPETEITEHLRLAGTFWGPIFDPPVQAGSPNYSSDCDQSGLTISSNRLCNLSIQPVLYSSCDLGFFYWGGNSISSCPHCLFLCLWAPLTTISQLIDYQLTLCKNNSLPHWKCISHCNSNSYELARERQATRSVFLVISFPCWHLVKQTLQKNI